MKKYVPRFTSVSLLILALSLPIYIACINFSWVADFFNSTISFGVRFLLAKFSVLLPFSIFEALIILSPILLAVLIFLLVRRGSDRRKRVRTVMALIGVISLIFTSYIYTLGIGYHTTALDERIGIEAKSEISKEELVRTVDTVLAEINDIAPRLTPSDGETRLAYSVSDLSDRLGEAYDTMLTKHPILTNYSSKVKPVHFSTVMSDLQITGIYSFFTGEANVNVEYPDYSLVFTSAHEMAHQRGISRENEANFVAFLVAVSSDDEYIRYAGYLNLFEYLASALYSLDPELYYSAYARLHETAMADIRAARAVYNEHKDSLLGEINEKLNDAYLKANGTDGIVSYSYVVRLAVAYYNDAKTS